MKILNGADEVRAIAAAIAPESTPPDTNAPTGTSDSWCSLTVRSSSARVRSIQSFSETPRSMFSRAVQKVRTSASPSAPMWSTWPGSSGRTWRKMVRGGSVWPKQKKSSTPSLVEIERMVRKLAQRGDFRREGEPARLLREKQRLDADGVAGERKLFRVLVPDGDREHAFQASPGVVAPA